MAEITVWAVFQDLEGQLESELVTYGNGIVTGITGGTTPPSNPYFLAPNPPANNPTTDELKTAVSNLSTALAMLPGKARTDAIKAAKKTLIKILRLMAKY